MTDRVWQRLSQPSWHLIVRDQLPHPTDSASGASPRMNIIAPGAEHPIVCMFNVEPGIEVPRPAGFFKVRPDDPLVPHEQDQAAIFNPNARNALDR